MRMTPLVSRLLALALLVGVLALPYFALVRPLIAAYANNASEIAEQRELMSQYRRLAANQDMLRTRLARLQQNALYRSAYLPGGNEVLVAAQLQERVKAVIEKAEGVQNSTQILQSEPENGFRRVTVRVRMTGNMNVLHQTFHELESSEPLLFVDNVDISVRRIRRRQPASAGAADEIQLNVGFDVYGYMRHS